MNMNKQRDKAGIWMVRAGIAVVAGWLLLWLTVVSLITWTVIHFAVKFW